MGAGRDSGRRPVGAAHVAFFLVFAVYAFGGILILAQGAGAALASAIPSLHQLLHLQGLDSGPAGRAFLRMADASHHVPSAAQVGLDFAFSLFNLGLAGFLLWLRRGDWTARLLAAGLVGAAGIFNLTAQATFEQLPLVAWESIPQALAHVIAGLCYVAALLLFPDARLVPRWPAPVLALLYGPAAAAVVVLPLRVEGAARPAALVFFFGLLTPAAGVLAQAYRFRRSPSATEKQQARLLFWALLPALGLGVFFTLTGQITPIAGSGLAGRHLPELPVLAFRVFQPVFAIIPIALFVGLLRYRLWDIDRIVNRTIVYTASTAMLGGAYIVIVVLLQRALSPVTRQSDLAVAVSTLAVAAAARPALRRVQDFVDRRFYRSRYDAARTIEAFAARLRDEVGLESLEYDLRSASMQTMQPSSVSTWRRAPDGGLAWSSTQRASALPRGIARNDSVTMPAYEEDVNATTLHVGPDDPLIAYLQSASGPVDLDKLTLDSPGVPTLRCTGTKLVVPLVSQGELIGLLNLGPRLSEQEYNSDDRRLLEQLASQAAPALRVAQLVRDQEAEVRLRERYEQELRVATLIQQNFLPRETPKLAGFELAALYRPAREVSGDFYDFIELPGDRLGIVCADVTDKGVPAALVMASTRSVLRAAAQRLDSPGEVLRRVNDMICPEMPEKMFVTCFYGILDPSTGLLVFANAGHDLPYKRSCDGVTALRARGMPLGLMPGMPYEEAEVVIAPGETVLFSSDGVVEAHSPDAEMFGCPRLVELLRTHKGGAGLIELVLDDLRGFTGPDWVQEDDITMVTLERTSI